MLIPPSAVERAMQIKEVLLRAMNREYSWLQAAEILGITPRGLRRLRQRMEQFGYQGLVDMRRGRPSPRRTPVAEIEASRGWSEAMEDPEEQLIRRALGRRRPPTLGPTLADDVLRRVASGGTPATGGRRPAPARLVVPWLAVVGASAAVLAHLPWSSGARAVGRALALILVPVAYSLTLWPARTLALVTVCGAALLADPREALPAASPATPSRSRS
jgi:hypothetical protein